MKKQKKILFLGPYPHGIGPSQRFRLEIYFPFLEEENIDFDYRTFFNHKDYRILYTKGAFFNKSWIIFKGMVKRFLLLFSIAKYDFIFIQREATPIGPPLFEWIASKVFRKKLIYDFDDAIWLPNYTDENARFHFLKSYWKVKNIIKWSHKVVVGNIFLLNYAKQFNTDIIHIPTVVNTKDYHNAELHDKRKNNTTIIGWTGSLTTNKHIESLENIFKKLNEKHDYNLLVISNKKPAINIPNLHYEGWDYENEIQQLLKIDIGIMPLKTDHLFYEGKCGFKAIQYMALGITTIVTPLGVNKHIVTDKINGYHATTKEDWYNILDKLLTDKPNMVDITTGRKKIQESYCVYQTKEEFIALFDSK